MITVVIPNYNGESYIGPCLNSLRRQTMQEFEVIIVDNGSTDGSLQEIHSHYPEVKIIELPENKGFSAAVNIGIKEAKSEFVVLMNTDTIAETEWLYHLKTCIESDSSLFSCSSKMLQYNNPELIDDAGDNYTITGWAFQNGRGLPEHQLLKSNYIFSSCAGAAIYRKELIEKVGWFDESFFAYLEDVDIGYRAQLQGYRNKFCPAARILHIGSATSGGMYSDFKVKLSARNNIYMIRKNMPTLQLIINFPLLFLGFIIMWWVMKKKLHGKAYLDGIKEGLDNRSVKNKKNIVPIISYYRIQICLIKNMFLYIFFWIKRKTH